MCDGPSLLTTSSWDADSDEVFYSDSELRITRYTAAGEAAESSTALPLSELEDSRDPRRLAQHPLFLQLLEVGCLRAPAPFS